ncbi:MAG: sulfotransferase [Phycisphaerales bacterium]|nr:sulfotransferase [Phycisphaerales bacterium]
MPKPSELLAQARSQLQSGRLKQADASLRAILRKHPRDADALFGLSLVAQRKREPAEAIEFARRAADAAPDNAAYQASLGRLLASTGQLDEAETALCRAVELRADDAHARAMLGSVLLHQHKVDEAEAQFDGALAVDADHAQALAGKAEALVAHGDAAAAVECAKRAVALHPQDPRYRFCLGNALHICGRSDEALTHLMHAAQAAPKWVDLYVCIAAASRSAGRRERASEAARRAIDIDPNHPGGHFQLGGILLDDGRTGEARACFEQALRLEEHHAQSLAGLGRLLELEGELQQAYDLLRPAVTDAASEPQACLTLATVCRRLKRHDEADQILDIIIEEPTVAAPSRRQALLARAQLHESAGRYDEAFACATRGHDLVKDDAAAAAEPALVDDLIDVYSRNACRDLPRTAIDSTRPILIVGMPRSGTSLVEQILASHPDVYGAGELPDVQHLTRRLVHLTGDKTPYPRCVPLASPAHLDELAKRYVSRLESLAPDAQHVTDKMPHNVYHLGLIAQILPHVRVIHCMRHPLDTCISCYLNNLNHVTHAYALDLARLGQTYRAYHRLIQHWHDVLDLSILDIAYEDVVADQDRMTHVLLEFCGVPWDDACLRFHETRRMAGTLSYEQVRRPMYSSSVARYRHYEQHLGPLKEALGDVLRQG